MSRRDFDLSMDLMSLVLLMVAGVLFWVAWLIGDALGYAFAGVLVLVVVGVSRWRCEARDKHGI